MRILFLSHRFPYPPTRGDKIRNFNVVRHLSLSHEVTVASLLRSDEEAETASGLAEFCSRVITARVHPASAIARMLTRLPRRVPSSMGYFFSPDLARKIRAELRTNSYDLIFVHCASVAQYVEGVVGIPKILDFGDMDSQKWLAYAAAKRWPLSWGYYLEGFKLQLAEMDLAGKFDYCTCVSETEVATLDGYGTGARTACVPIGVDVDRFKPSDEPPVPASLCFVGRMDYFPNQQCMVEFCREVLPRVREQRPETTLTIVGAEPSAEIRALGRLPGVTVTGTVPDVIPYLHRAQISVNPLRIARGAQTKVLEAMAAGLPTICSSIAARGVDAVPGEHLVVADSQDELAACILGLLSNPDRRRELAAAGQQRIVSHHHWSTCLRKLDEIILEVTGPEI